MQVTVRSTNAYLSRLHGELAAARHRVTGVDAQVHHYLAYLTRVSNHRRQISAAMKNKIDILADSSCEHARCLADNGGQVKHFRRQHLLPTKRKQLLGECSGAVSSRKDPI